MSEDGPNRTVFKPSPLSARTGAPATPPGGAQGYAQPSYGQPAAVARPAPATPDSRIRPDDVPQPAPPATQRNPLTAAAAPFLALVAGVRAGRARISLPELHGRSAAAIAAFDQALKGRVPEEHLTRARYALSATVDDVALNLPYQAADAAEWARRSMVVHFFGEAIGGDRFWRLVDEMVARPTEFADVLELYHACMAAGFEGRYRVADGGRSAHQQVMQRVYQALEAPRAVSMSELSPRWRGVPTAARKVGFWTPLALAAGAAVLALLLVYIVLRIILAQTGGPAVAALKAVNPDEPVRLSRVAPAPPTPVEGAQSLRLRTFLAPEIAQGLVQVVEDAATVRVRTTAGQLFRSGSDQLEPERLALFDRIAQAIETEPGPVRIEGYTDSDQPRGTISFPDNTALSQARAETVAALVRGRLSDGNRVTAEGYGEQSPVAGNETAAGKARNRRVEIVIQRRG